MENVTVMEYLVFLVLVWLVASFPFGLLVAMIGCGMDPRLSGSRNTGATNVARLCGTRYGIVTLALDLAKGFVPVVMARAMGGSWFFVSLVIVAAVLAHMYSVFLNGKGGKGVATAIGVFLAAAPCSALVAVLCCVAVIRFTGYVSAGSLVLAVALPVLTYLFGSAQFTLAALVVAGFVIWKHRDNITRLRAGQEVSWRKSRECAA